MSLVVRPSPSTTRQENERVAYVQRKFRDKLRLPHVDEDTILNCCGDDYDSLEQLALQLHAQTERARQVFHLLDTAGKGVVVVEDLQRAVSEVYDTTNNINDGNNIEDDDLNEMIQEFDNSGGSGLLTEDDLILIARKVGL